MGLKALILAVAAYAALGAFQFSNFAWKRSSDSGSAYTMHPDDPVALSAHILAAIASDPAYLLTKIDVAHARASLIKAPLSSQSLWIIGKSAQESGNIAGADAAMALAAKVTQRDTLNQLWLIERSVEKDDIRKAVHHYNAVLSVDIRLEKTLFPILSQAISFPEVRAALAPYLAKNARWAPVFVRYAAANAGIADFLELATALGDGLQSDNYAVANQIMIQRIAKERGPFVALDYAAKALPDLDPEAFDSPGFSSITTDTRLGSLAWRLTNRQGIDTSLDRDNGLIVVLQPGAFGTVTMRDFPVKPGSTYLFSQTIRDTGDVPGTSLRWLARCGSGREAVTIAQFDIPWPKDTGTFQSKIVVSSDCKLLNLRLTAESSESQLPASFEISQFGLRKL